MTALDRTITERSKLRVFLKEGVVVSRPLPLTSEIRLYLFNQDHLTRTLTPGERQEYMEEPLFWAFCWASGQVLARWLLDFPENVRGKRILDFGAGSGVAGIAAARCGAGEVIGLDTDPLACEAISANADLNRVNVGVADDLRSVAGRFDLICAADVLYERDNLPLLDVLMGISDRVIVADSRMKNLAEPFTRIGTGTAITCPDLKEPEEYQHVSIFEHFALP